MDGEEREFGRGLHSFYLIMYGIKRTRYIDAFFVGLHFALHLYKNEIIRRKLNEMVGVRGLTFFSSFIHCINLKCNIFIKLITIK